MKTLLALPLLLTSCTWMTILPIVTKVAEEAYQNYPSDNYVEEQAEKWIQDKTGVDIDISPMSPEKKKK